MDVSQWVAVGLGVAASLFDLRTRRIPNVLTFGAAAAAVAFHLWTGGAGGAGGALGGWLAGALLFFPLFALGGMGAGDVKLLAAVGAWLGPWQALWVALYSSIAGGVVAIVAGVWTGYLGTALANLRILLMHWRVFGPTPVTGMTLDTSASPRLPRAVPIAAGTALAVWLR